MKSKIANALSINGRIAQIKRIQAKFIFIALIVLSTEAWTQDIQKEIHSSLSHSLGGTDVGGGHIGSQFAAEWCRDQMERLYSFQERAQLKLNSSGDYYQANLILLNGLLEGLESSRGNRTFTNRSMSRGFELFKMIGTDDISKLKRERMIINRAMNKYYSFLRYISIDLDLDKLIPQQSLYESYGDLWPSRTNNFEKKVIDYAARQLHWFLDVFTSSRNEELMALGTTSDFFKSTEIILRGVKDEAEESLFKEHLSCDIRKMNSLIEIVIQYNLDNRELFDGDRMAENYVIARLKDLLSSMEELRSCT